MYTTSCTRATSFFVDISISEFQFKHFSWRFFRFPDNSQFLRRPNRQASGPPVVVSSKQSVASDVKHEMSVKVATKSHILGTSQLQHEC